jgi:hypothetical protein
MSTEIITFATQLTAIVVPERPAALLTLSEQEVSRTLEMPRQLLRRPHISF